MNKVTIHEIAKILDLNSSTVSRALNDSSRVKEKTKKRIVEKATELGYKRNFLASSLRKNRSNTIGVIVPKISKNFYSSSIAGIEERAYEAGISVIISQSLEKLTREKKLVNTLFSNQVDGILIAVSLETSQGLHLKNIKKAKLPLVFFDRHLPQMEDSNKVLVDNFKGAYEATKHLIDNHCKKIMHLSGPQELAIYKNRFLGYKKALEDHHILYDPALVVSSELSEKDGKQIIMELVQKKKAIDGIFSGNDLAAIGAIKYLKKIGKKIPKEIAIVGFSNSPSAEIIEPALSTVAQSGFEIGKLACTLLIDRINQENPTSSHKTILIAPKLVIRNSSNKILEYE